MIIFLYGLDSYRAREKLREIIERYKKIHKSGLNLKYLDFSEKEVNFSDLKDKVSQASMFKEKKLIVMVDFFKRIDKKALKDFVKTDDILLCYQEGEINKNTNLFRFLEKNAKCQEFRPLSGEKLKRWVQQEFNKTKARITPLALSKLIEYVGNDLWRMSNEIKKLASFKKAEIIEKEDIDFLVRPEHETDIFKTIEAIAQQNKKKALKLIHRHLEKGDTPLYLLSMINYQFRNILMIKDLVENHKPYSLILKKTTLHPFVVQKGYSLARRFSLPELKKIYRKIFRVDLNIKTGKVEPEVALDMLIAEI